MYTVTKHCILLCIYATIVIKKIITFILALDVKVQALKDSNIIKLINIKSFHT